MMDVSLIPPGHVAWVWAEVREFLLRALEAGGEEAGITELMRRLETGEYQLWVAFDEHARIKSACATYVSHRLTDRALVIAYCGGMDMGTWLRDGLCLLERFARDHGCTEILCFGREGWGRALAGYGWKPGRLSFAKELTP